MPQVLAAILLPLAASMVLIHAPGAGFSLLPPLTAFILIPNIAAILVLATKDSWAKWISLVCASAELGVALNVFHGYQVSLGGFQMVEEVPWLTNFGIKYLLGVDGMSTLMVFLVACVYFAGTLISWKINLRIKEYFVLFSLLVGGVAGAY